MSNSQNFGTGPGSSEAAFTETYEIFWGGRYEDLRILTLSATIAGSTRDLGNTERPNVLRPGLMLGQLDASGELVAYNPNGNDGSQNFKGINPNILVMVDPVTGQNEPKPQANIVITAPLRASEILVNGVPLTGSTLSPADEAAARAALATNFILDDILG